MLWWNWKLETCSGAAFNKHSIFFTDLSHCTNSLPPWLVKGKTCPFQKRCNSHERMLAAQIRLNNVYYLLFRVQLIFHLHQCIQSHVDLCFTSGFNPWMPFVGYCGQCWKLWSHLVPLVWVWVCPGITIVLTGSLWRVWGGILEQFTCLAIHIHSLDFVSGIWMLGNLHLQIKLHFKDRSHDFSDFRPRWFLFSHWTVTLPSATCAMPLIGIT